MTASNSSIQIRHHQVGFTLVEMAIVLLVVGLLLGGLLPTLSSQVEQRRITETNKQLEEIKEALIGFTIINGRLPCPATATSNGTESFASGGSITNGSCSNFLDGFIPAATLGLSGANSAGLIEDPWGFPIRYAVTNWQSSGNYVFTAYDPSNSRGMSSIGISNLSPNLYVCSTATGISGSSCASGNSLTTQGVPAIIYSTGPNAGSGGSSTDESVNPNPNNDDNNQTFVSHEPSSSSSTNGAFDDIMVWISPNTLINRMVAAGKLP